MRFFFIINPPEILVLFIGPIFLLFGILFMVSYKRRSITCNRYTTAKAVSIAEERDPNAYGKYAIIYYLIFNYYVNGRDYYLKLRIMKDNCKYRIGDSIMICYDPNDPSKSNMVGDKTMKWAGLVLIITGLSIIAIIMIAYLLDRDSFAFH